MQSLQSLRGVVGVSVFQELPRPSKGALWLALEAGERLRLEPVAVLNCRA